MKKKKELSVSLNYSSAEGAPGTALHRSPLALPIDVLDADGSLVATGVASATTPAALDVSGADGPLFVRLTWPSGKTQTQAVTVPEGSPRTLHFDDSSIATNEWSAWAVPRLNKRSILAQPAAKPSVRIDRFNRVWLRLWHRQGGQWTPSPLSASKIAAYHSEAVRQLDLDLAGEAWLLQLGGATVPWRFVALPGGGLCRVLLTPNASTDPRAERLKVIVTSFRSEAETLLEFLARDAIRAATALAGFQPLATRLVADKTSDPVSATAGAYFLLRTNGWRDIPISWFDNLNTLFPWLADGAVIRCTVSIRQGLSKRQEKDRAVSYLRECLQRGVPLFAEGLSLLQEAAAVLRSATHELSDEPFAFIERLAAARAWAGAALSFYGESPDLPSPKQRLGLPDDSVQASQRSPHPALAKWSRLRGPVLPARAPRRPRARSTAEVVFLNDLS
jgi:hypothetical protein